MKTLQDHIAVMDQLLINADFTMTGEKRSKVIKLMEGLVNSTCRDYRRRTLGKLRDSISYLHTAPVFANIKAYELWCK